MEFPKWKFHPQLASVIVNTIDEEESLGGEWSDLPYPAAASTGTIEGVSVREIFTTWLDFEGLTDEDPGVLNLLFNAFTARGRQGDAELFVDEPEADGSEERRQSLLAQAKELGLDLHHRTGVEKIQAAIDTKLAAE